MTDLKSTHTIVKLFTDIFTQIITQVIVNELEMTKMNSNLRRLIIYSLRNSVQVKNGLLSIKIRENDNRKVLWQRYLDIENIYG